MKGTLIVAGVLLGLAMPTGASAQGVIGGAQQGASQGAKQGNKAAGPVGGAVGGVVGGAVGAAVGGVNGVLGIQPRKSRRHKSP